MWALLVVEIDPVTNDSIRMRQSLETMTMGALFLQRPDQSFNEPILLRRVGRDERLLQAIAFDRRRVTAAGKSQAIIRAQQEGFIHLARGAKSGDQGLLRG